MKERVKVLVLVVLVGLTTAVVAQDDEPPTACADYRPGEDDLQTWDVLRPFRLDSWNGTEVSTVRGSSRHQTAFRLDRDANLTLPTSEVFPRGVPQRFSLICTWRARKQPRSSWHLIRITDFRNRPQLLLILDPVTRTVTLALPRTPTGLQQASFMRPQLFDRGWHKVHFGVHEDHVAFFADCSDVGEAPLQPRPPVDTSGAVSIARQASSNTAVPLELQWMVINCDPGRPDRDACLELPPQVVEQQGSCEVVCPQGPPGYNGTDVRIEQYKYYNNRLILTDIGSAWTNWRTGFPRIPRR